MQLGVGRRLGQLAHGRAKATPRRGGHGGKHRPGRLIRFRQRGGSVRGRHKCLEEIDVALRVEIGDELLAQPVDLLLEQVEQGRRRLLVAGRKRARASAQPLQQHFTVTNRTQAHREPAKLRAKGLGPSRVEQRTERPQVGAHLPRRHASLVHRFWIAAGPDEWIVVQQGSDRLGEHVLDDVVGRRVRQQRSLRDFGWLDGSRAEGPDVLRCRIWRPRSRATQPGHKRRDDPVHAVLPRNLDLYLAEPRCDATPVADGYLVIHHLGDACPAGVDQAHAAADCGKASHRHKLGLADVSAHDLERRLWRPLRTALERQLITLEDGALIARLRRRFGELERPAFPGAVPERHTPPRETEVGSVVVDGFHAHRLGRSDRHAFDHAGEVGEVERGACPELHLSLKHASGHRPHFHARSRARAP